MRGELILQSDIILLVSCQYSVSDTKQSIPHFDENESNSSLHNIRKYFVYCIHFKVTYYILFFKKWFYDKHINHCVSNISFPASNCIHAKLKVNIIGVWCLLNFPLDKNELN